MWSEENRTHPSGLFAYGSSQRVLLLGPPESRRLTYCTVCWHFESVQTRQKTRQGAFNTARLSEKVAASLQREDSNGSKKGVRDPGRNLETEGSYGDRLVERKREIASTNSGVGLVALNHEERQQQIESLTESPDTLHRRSYRLLV